MKRTYTDKQKIEYYRKKAQEAAANVSTNGYKSSEKPQYKKSSATFTKISKGENEGLWAVNAFKKTRTGVIKATAFPLTNKSKESSKGNQYVPYLVTCIDMNTLQSTKYNAIMNIQTKVLVISDLGYCITPNGSGVTARGVRLKGYFGKFTK